MITIKELQLDNETALKLINLIKKEEPDIWKVLKEELIEALNIQKVNNCTQCNAEINYKGVCEMCYTELKLNGLS